MIASPITPGSEMWPKLRVEYWPIERLKPYERNPRKNDKAVDRIRASIRQFGFAVPILAKSDGEVIDGHLRLKGAIAENMREVPVIPCDGWTDAQVKAFRLMVNRSVTWAEWDEDALALELGEIQELDLDLSLTGFDPGEIDKLLVLDDEERANAAPPRPETPVSKLGDLWVLGPHRVLCSDATSSEAPAAGAGAVSSVIVEVIWVSPWAVIAASRHESLWSAEDARPLCESAMQAMEWRCLAGSVTD